MPENNIITKDKNQEFTIIIDSWIAPSDLKTGDIGLNIETDNPYTVNQVLEDYIITGKILKDDSKLDKYREYLDDESVTIEYPKGLSSTELNNAKVVISSITKDVKYEFNLKFTITKPFDISNYTFNNRIFKVGDKLSWTDLVDRTDDIYLIEVEGDYDLNKEGTYKVAYVVTNNKGEKFRIEDKLFTVIGELEPNPQPEPQPEPTPEPIPQPKPQPEPIPQPEPQPQPEPIPQPEPTPGTETGEVIVPGEVIIPDNKSEEHDNDNTGSGNSNNSGNSGIFGWIIGERDKDTPIYKTEEKKNTTKDTTKRDNSLIVNQFIDLGRRDMQINKSETGKPGINKQSKVNNTINRNYIELLLNGKSKNKNVYEVKDSKGNVISTVEKVLDPYIYKNKTMVSMRDMANILGIKVEWDEKTMTATFTKDDLKIMINLTTNQMKYTLQNSENNSEASKRLKEIFKDPAKYNIYVQTKDNRITMTLTGIANIFGYTNGNEDDGIKNDIEWFNNQTVRVYK